MRPRDFPANREIIRELSEFPPIFGDLGVTDVRSRSNLRSLRPIPCILQNSEFSLPEQGSLRWSRELSDGAAEALAAFGLRAAVSATAGRPSRRVFAANRVRERSGDNMAFVASSDHFTCWIGFLYHNSPIPVKPESRRGSRPKRIGVARDRRVPRRTLAHRHHDRRPTPAIKASSYRLYRLQRQGKMRDGKRR